MQPDYETVRLAADGASAELSLTGAEPLSWRIGERNLLWSGDPLHWSFHAPILFPVVGASAGGVVTVGGVTYPMTQHGFARRLPFVVADRQAASVRLRLEESEATRLHYPFRFTLDVVATLDPGSLQLAFEVTNRDTSPMPYAVGFHPAFPWPLDGGGREGHRIVFEAAENPVVPEVAEGGLLARTGRRVPFEGRVMPLSPELFTEALVFLDARSRRMTFEAPSGASIAMTVEDFPHLAVWTKPTAPFVSLECWTGHADWRGFEGELADRDSMRTLPPGAAGRHTVALAWEAGAAGGRRG